MDHEGDWIRKTAECETLDEFSRVLFQDVGECCKAVAQCRAFLVALEGLAPSLKPTTDRSLVKLRAYGLQAKWNWASDRAMALDLAELVEEMEAVRQRTDWQALRYWEVLLRLVADKLDMDRGQCMLQCITNASFDEKEKLFQDFKSAVQLGAEEGVKKISKYQKALQNDVLSGYKGYANMELGKERFVGTAEPLE